MDIKPASNEDLMNRINKTEIDARPPMERMPYEWRDYAREQNRCVEGSVKMAAVKRLFHKVFGGKR